MKRVQVWPVAVFLAGFVFLFIGERLYPTSMMVRILADAVGGLMFVAGLAGRMRERASASADLKRVLGIVATLMIASVVAVALHWLAAAPVVEALGLADESAGRYRVVINCLWTIGVSATLLPLIFVEVSLASAASAPVLEIGRIWRSLEAGLVLSLALSLLFAVNYLADQHNIREDLSYDKTTEPGSATLLLMESLTEPVRIVLFFPAANDVKEEVLPYFEALAETNELVTLEQLDHDAEPAMAKELKARKNGTVVLVIGDNTESLDLGTDIDKATKKLKKLDKEIHKRLIKVSKPQAVVYMTAGHGERDWTKIEDDDRALLKDLRSLLQYFNYKIKRLGMAEGLASEIDDAGVVMIIGPTGEFMPSEIEALQEYLDRGGRLMVFLDAEQEVTLAPLLAPLGMAFHAETMANDQPGSFYPATRTTAARKWLVTNKFASHPSVDVLQKNNRRFPLLLVDSGYLVEIEGADAQPKVVLKSPAKTWADLDDDYIYNGDEKRDTYNLGMAVSRSVTVEGEEEPLESRVLVFADTDMIADGVLPNDGPTNLVANCMRWMVDEEDLAGEIVSEEDVKIQHTREGDVWWYYSTIFGIPLTVLGIGILYTTRRKRRARR